ncbi:MAG: hypothetical protein HQL88_05955, partial [Magnetococcales bacterium]|nr:hypothetical protein [Magnetococcales bacterium]
DPGWRPVRAEGLAERLLAYAFPDQLEMELQLHPSVTDVRSYQDAAAGLYIIELFTKEQLGRQGDAENTIRRRKEALASGEVRPLNRMDPAFVASPERTVTLNQRTIDESYYLKNAQVAAKDGKFARARGYLRKMLQVFPDTPNRQLIEFYLWDLAYQMNWKPAWLLAGLNHLLARYPNTVHYPHYRLLQLHLLNRAGLYEEAHQIQWDPNLPKENVRVWLERGHAAAGMSQSHLGEQKYWQETKQALNKVLELTDDKGEISAEAHYLLIRATQARTDPEGESAPRLVDALSSEQLAFISNRPDWLMAMADIYYEHRLYQKAFKFYSQFLSSYPTVQRIAPWALLRAAESSWQLGRLEAEKSQQRRDRFFDARYLFRTLREQYPKTDAAVWGQVFQLRMNEGQDTVTRLRKINEVIKTIRLPDALSELFMVKAELQGGDHRYEDALVTLNRLLAATQEAKVVARANKLKREYLMAGMQDDLEHGHPEHAILLVELNGEDVRGKEHYARVRLLLAEALLRMGIGLPETVAPLLENLTTPGAVRLNQLSRDFAAGRWPEVSAPPETGAAVRAMREAHPAVGTGAPPVEEGFSALSLAASGNHPAPPDATAADGMETEPVPIEEARVRLDEASRLLDSKEWEPILHLLEKLPDNLLNPSGQARRLRLMAKAEEGRGRFPFAVQYLEDLLAGKQLEDGSDYYWYATVLQQWKGDDKALPAFKRVCEEASDPDVQALAHIRVADIMQHAGEYAGARDHYREAERIAPNGPWAKVSKENAAQLEMAMEVAK